MRTFYDFFSSDLKYLFWYKKQHDILCKTYTAIVFLFCAQCKVKPTLTSIVVNNIKYLNRGHLSLGYFQKPYFVIVVWSVCDILP